MVYSLLHYVKYILHWRAIFFASFAASQPFILAVAKNDIELAVEQLELLVNLREVIANDQDQRAE